MTLLLNRRQLLHVGAFGVGALATPGAASLLGVRGFSHGVASGEPGAHSVMLWTRYVPAAGGARLDYQISPTVDFATVLAGGTIEAQPERDWCVKPVVAGLQPDRWYYYRFVDPEGRFSPVGRTRTLPQGSTERFRVGAFTCANLPFGWFNAYGHAAGRDDLDLLVHLGDYFYEYRRGEYPSAAQAMTNRLIEPASEAVALADYRLRYASYRADPDLQRLHQLFPMIVMWDDHESANDSWSGGAQNHQSATEGDWRTRKAAAMRAFREWLPVSDESWASYEIGDLATLFRLESRLTARSQPLDLGAALRGRSDVAETLVRFRNGPWSDENRTLLGREQESWLAGGLRASVRQGTKWQLLAQQVVMGSLFLSPEIAAFLAADAGEEAHRRTALGLAAARAGIPFNLDAWDGFPAARERLLRSARDAGANLLVLSGDSHNAWAFDLDRGGDPVGAEMAVHSVTSPGFEAYVGRAAPADVARAVLARNRQLKWADTSRRGYLTLELTPERATGTWHLLDTIRTRSTELTDRHRMRVRHGTNRFESERDSS
jgi:alkaline phosphatase D